MNAQLLRGETKKRQRLKALGIDYSFPGYAASAGEQESEESEEEGDSEEEEEESEGDSEEESEDEPAPVVKKGAKKASRVATNKRRKG